MGKKNKKEIETEIWVNDYISKNGFPPTYLEIQTHFKLKSNCPAWVRCRSFRDKMKKNFNKEHLKYPISVLKEQLAGHEMALMNEETVYENKQFKVNWTEWQCKQFIDSLKNEINSLNKAINLLNK